ncbi:hypothetical protein M514_08859 [Trichuris suis]|uniref:Helix-turn-helix type 11 domain-containing protein n=1 Tax=Trichuris suis TaxID=68888 RepID=A0A085MSX5_9BILA|nr:hypothetical protein M514_08859 [Trichuris suis]
MRTPHEDKYRSEIVESNAEYLYTCTFLVTCLDLGIVLTCEELLKQKAVNQVLTSRVNSRTWKIIMVALAFVAACSLIWWLSRRLEPQPDSEWSGSSKSSRSARQQFTPRSLNQPTERNRKQKTASECPEIPSGANQFLPNKLGPLPRATRSFNLAKRQSRAADTVIDPSRGIVLPDEVQRTVDTLWSLGQPFKMRKKVSPLMILLLAPESNSIHKRVPFTRAVIIIGWVVDVDSSCALNRRALNVLEAPAIGASSLLEGALSTVVPSIGASRAVRTPGKTPLLGRSDAGERVICIQSIGISSGGRVRIHSTSLRERLRRLQQGITPSQGRAASARTNGTATLHLVTRKPAGRGSYYPARGNYISHSAMQVSDEITYRLAFPLNTGLETKPLDDLVWRRAKMGPIFASGCESLEGPPRTGPPSSFDNQALKELVESDPTQTQDEMAVKLAVSRQTICTHLKQLGKVKKLDNTLSRAVGEAEHEVSIRRVRELYGLGVSIIYGLNKQKR